MAYSFTYLWNLKNKTNEQEEQKEAHRNREHFDGSQMEGCLGGCVKKMKGVRSTNQ